MRLGANRPRPTLTLPIMMWALVDVAGMTLLAIGGMYLAQGKALFFRDFPSTQPEAWGCLVLGVGLMWYAVARILRELLKQAPQADAAHPD